MFKQAKLEKIGSYDIEKLRIQYDSHPYYGKIDIPNFLPEQVSEQCAIDLDHGGL